MLATVILLSIIILEVSYIIIRLGLIPSPKSKHEVFIDTSALMDGRIVTAAKTGFMPERLVIPKSVVSELQLLADQADSEKRSRARRGLDAIQELQQMDTVHVSILTDKPVGNGGVDERLIELANRHAGSICTIDFNLNKSATVQGIRVLNINELAGSIRMAFLPGETISLTPTQKGQGSGQAVGYLADGTMVVIDRAADVIGQSIEIEFIRSLQTAAGRMMFAKRIGAGDTERKISEASRRGKSKDGPQSSHSRRTATTKSTGRSPRRAPQQAEDSLIELVNKQ